MKRQKYLAVAQVQARHSKVPAPHIPGTRPVVVETNTVVDPRTMVVHLHHALLADLMPMDLVVYMDGFVVCINLRIHPGAWVFYSMKIKYIPVS